MLNANLFVPLLPVQLVNILGYAINHVSFRAYEYLSPCTSIPFKSYEQFRLVVPTWTPSKASSSEQGNLQDLERILSINDEILLGLVWQIKLFFSFVQEFASPPADGITLLLETLRGVQLAQSSPPSSGHTGPRVGTRRAALDELGCVECLAACTERCTDAPRLLVQAQPGLLALAVCLTSSLNRSRVLALQVTIVTSVPSIYVGTVSQKRARLRSYVEYLTRPSRS